MIMITSVLLAVIGVYLAIGFVFAIIFHWIGLPRLDPGVAAAGTVFRIVITPGIAALWPLLALKWYRSTRRGNDPFGDNITPVSPERIRHIHLATMQLLAILLPLLFAAAILLRPDEPVTGIPDALESLTGPPAEAPPIHFPDV